MPNFLTFVFNPYDRKARLYPALLTALPILVSIVLLIPEFDPIWVSVGSLILYCGVTTFLTQIGRDRGKLLEPVLFHSWGGKPSVAMLRHSDTRLGVMTKERYRSFLTSVVSGLKLASEEEERRYPEQAEDGYESATAWLLAQTRDRERFELLFRENMNYGFRRNTWALRPWAFIIEGVSIALITVLVFNLWTGEPISTIQSVDTRIWVSIVLTLMHMLFFIFNVRRKWVRLTAEAYAQHLLAACDTLESEQKS